MRDIRLPWLITAKSFRKLSERAIPWKLLVMTNDAFLMRFKNSIGPASWQNLSKKYGEWMLTDTPITGMPSNLRRKAKISAQNLLLSNP